MRLIVLLAIIPSAMCFCNPLPKGGATCVRVRKSNPAAVQEEGKALSQRCEKSMFPPAERPLLIRPDSQPDAGLWMFEQNGEPPASPFYGGWVAIGLASLLQQGPCTPLVLVLADGAQQPHDQFGWYASRIRMALYALKDGTGIVYNPIGATEETLQAVVDTIGEPGHIVFPTNSPEHTIFVNEWTARFPGATFWGLRGMELEGARVQKDLEDFPPAWQSELDISIMNGSPLLRECFLLHKATRTVFAIDSFAHIGEEQIISTWGKRVLQALGTFGRPACSTKMFLWDKLACRQAVDKVLSWDFDAVFPTHGQCPVADGKRIMTEEFRFLYY